MMDDACKCPVRVVETDGFGDHPAGPLRTKQGPYFCQNSLTDILFSAASSAALASRKELLVPNLIPEACSMSADV